MTRLVRALLAACAVLLPSAVFSDADASSSASSSAPLRLHSASLSSWQFRSLNGSIAVANATTPGTSHTHLLAAGVLPEDPYRRFHELDWQWVATTTWVYETSLPALPADASAVSVAFHTLDGVAHVALNGQTLGVAVNAFRPHVFQLQPSLLQASGNTLQVTFTPPLEYMKQQAAKYPYDVPSTQNFNVWAEPTHRPFLRKAGSDFGWDWGPAYATSGIAGDVVVEWLAPDSEGVQLRLVDLNMNYAFAGSNNNDNFSVVHGNVSVDVESVGGGSCVGSVVLQLQFDGEDHGQPVVVPLSCDELLTKTEAFLPFEIQHPTLWWPAGSGDPHLYDLQVLAYTATQSGSSPASPPPPATATLSHRVGFRRVELIQEPTTAGNITGGTFFFRINGVDTFMKGANWIPSDSFPTRSTPAMREFLLQSALAANMNMVRVWGGGRYEADAFYETCDRLGLLVWHEFMFACAMYPRDTAFLDDAALEIAYQTRRLRKYTSLAIWGGNNENENSLAWHDNDATPFNRDAAVADFTKLFVDTLRPIVLALDHEQRPFVDTSPSNGLLSKDPYVKRWGKDANDIAFGDVHYYNYTGDCQDFRMYPHARFVSEFGFQSVPSFEALEDVSSPEDWESLQSFWKLLKFRERHENGTREMATQMARHLHVPFPFLDEAWLETPLVHTAGFQLDIRKRVATYTYLTQIQQSMCYKTAIETWRRGRNVMLGGTMGILYWQLNDVWQGTSWSSMEFNGRWKSLQYAVKRAFAPVLLTPSEEGEDVVLYGVSDLKDRDVEVTFVSELVATDSGRVVKTVDHGPHPQTIRRLASEPLIRFAIKPLLENTPDCDATRCLLRVRCGGDDVPQDQRVCEDAFYFFAPFKQLALRHSRVVVDRITIVQQEPLVASVELRSDAFVALFVEVELPRTRGFWDRNSIHMIGNDTQTLRFTTAASEPQTTPVQWTAETLAEKLQLRWLQQTYETEVTVTMQ